MENKTCFVISPIGEAGSEVRKKADDVYHNIILPATSQLNITAVRSDHINKPGNISEQMFAILHNADLCIADLTSRNPNVYYELAIAQKACRPVIILLSKGETLPFDVRDIRCIYYDATAEDAKDCVNTVIDFMKDFEANNWQVVDIFKKFQPPQKYTDEPVEFDQVQSMAEKTTVYKILNLHPAHKKGKPVYNKFIPRLKEQQNIGVYNEYMATLITRFDQPVKNYSHGHRTDGDALELNGLMPFKFNLDDPDYAANGITPVIPGPSRVIINQMYAYNFYTGGLLNLSTKAEKDTIITRFVIDFSSIPGYDKIISPKPRLIYRCFDETNTIIPKELRVETRDPGIFWVQVEHMKKDEALRFEFDPV